MTALISTPRLSSQILISLFHPNPIILAGVTSVDVVDNYTVKVNLSNYSNLILYQFASNYACCLYSPTALQKNGADWAATHPVGTGTLHAERFPAEYLNEFS